MFLLIPNRIREIKEEGRQEARAEAVREGRIEGRAEGRREARRRIAWLRARYEKGEITLDEFFELMFDDRCDVCGRSG